MGAVERIKKGDDSWLTEDFMLSGYIHNLDEFAHIWGEVIRRLIEPENRPLLFHCTGGKDRAGTCAALILLALGVPEKNSPLMITSCQMSLLPTLSRMFINESPHMVLILKSCPLILRHPVNVSSLSSSIFTKPMALLSIT